jgi:5-formyltetrahydrofolate cyclo-ligase
MINSEVTEPPDLPDLPHLPDEVTRAKRALRHRVLQLRDHMSAEQRAADSARCVERLLDLDDYRHAQIVLSYMGFGSEIMTLPLFDLMRKAGKSIALPRMLPPASGQPSRLSLHRVDAVSALVAGRWGIGEPTPQAPIVDVSSLDLIVIPGVAFDLRAGRLGYGKGYYDHLLGTRHLQHRPHAAIVALAFDCQVVDQVPITARDEKIDVLITPTQFFDFRT